MKTFIRNLIITLVFTSLPTLTYAYNHNYHTQCMNLRWKLLGTNRTTGFYYDVTSIEKENSYLPFQDKIIRFWVALHYDYTNPYRIHYTNKTRYEINLDKKTYKILNEKNILEKSIEPDSLEEYLYIKAISFYEEDNLIENISDNIKNEINNFNETIKRAQKTAKELKEK